MTRATERYNGAPQELSALASRIYGCLIMRSQRHAERQPTVDHVQRDVGRKRGCKQPARAIVKELRGTRMCEDRRPPVCQEVPICLGHAEMRHCAALGDIGKDRALWRIAQTVEVTSSKSP